MGITVLTAIMLWGMIPFRTYHTNKIVNFEKPQERFGCAYTLFGTLPEKVRITELLPNTNIEFDMKYFGSDLEPTE